MTDRSERLGERAQRGVLGGDVGVVAFDHDQLGHRLAGDRLAFAGAPVEHAAMRLGDLVGRVVCERRSDDVSAGTEMFLRQLREFLRDRLERVPIGAGFPWRRYGGVERVHEGVEVGRGEVVLLIPRRGRKHDVGEERVGRHAKVDGGEEVELGLGWLPPGHVARPVLGGRLLGAHTGLGRAQHVLEEVFMALARRPEQVCPPHGHHPGMILVRIGVLAGEPKPPRAELRHDELGRIDSRPLGLIDQVEAASVEARERRQPAEPGTERVHVGDMHVVERAFAQG